MCDVTIVNSMEISAVKGILPVFSTILSNLDII